MTNAAKTLFTVASLLFTGAACAVAQVSEAQPQQTPAPIVRAHHEHSPQQETRKLTRRLGLSQEQAAQVEPILAAKHAQMEALRNSAPTDPQAMHRQKHLIAQDTRQKLDAVLTEPQRAQLAEMHRHHRQEKQAAQAGPAA